MCFDPKKLFAAFSGITLSKRQVEFSDAPNPYFNFIDLLQAKLSANFGRVDLNKTTQVYSLWENYIFGEKVKIMVLLIPFRTVGKRNSGAF